MAWIDHAAQARTEEITSYFGPSKKTDKALIFMQNYKVF
jgi:hypothetical protein